jgi:tRNA wybutosine-synthesizing protein 3
MERKSFLQSKKSVLLRKDHSFIGEWDEKIIPLCNKINSLENYYTNSSCSGRIILMVDQEKKGEGLFKFITHEKIKFEELKKEIKKILESKEKRDIKLKTEPPIIHITCFEFKDAKKLAMLSNLAGFKKTGLISFDRKIILEVISGEKIELPIIKKGKLLIEEEFLKIILENSNKKLESSWKKIKKLEKNLS